MFSMQIKLNCVRCVFRWIFAPRAITTFCVDLCDDNGSSPRFSKPLKRASKRMEKISCSCVSMAVATMSEIKMCRLLNKISKCGAMHVFVYPSFSLCLIPRPLLVRSRKFKCAQRFFVFINFLLIPGMLMPVCII